MHGTRRSDVGAGTKATRAAWTPATVPQGLPRAAVRHARELIERQLRDELGWPVPLLVVESKDGEPFEASLTGRFDFGRETLLDRLVETIAPPLVEHLEARGLAVAVAGDIPRFWNPEQGLQVIADDVRGTLPGVVMVACGAEFSWWWRAECQGGEGRRHAVNWDGPNGSPETQEGRALRALLRRPTRT